MKRFIHRFFLYSLFPILYFCINGIVNYYIYTNEKIKIKTNVLILGDSHPLQALNPTLFSQAVNISQVGEPYAVTYWKLKSILKYSKLDTVIIGFAPHDLSALNDLKFSDEKWSSEMFRRYYPIQEFKNFTTVSVDYTELYKVIWKQTCFYPKKSQANYIGQYTSSKYSNPTDGAATIQRHYYNYHNGKLLGISATSIVYLDSLISICTLHGITPVLINTPVHQTYYKQMPLINKSAFEDEEKKLISKKIIIIDKFKEPYPDSLFFNSDHLNDRGADKFTKEIIKTLHQRTDTNNTNTTGL